MWTGRHDFCQSCLAAKTSLFWDKLDQIFYISRDLNLASTIKHDVL